MVPPSSPSLLSKGSLHVSVLGAEPRPRVWAPGPKELAQGSHFFLGEAGLTGGCGKPRKGVEKVRGQLLCGYTPQRSEPRDSKIHLHALAHSSISLRRQNVATNQMLVYR